MSLTVFALFLAMAACVTAHHHYSGSGAFLMRGGFCDRESGRKHSRGAIYGCGPDTQLSVNDQKTKLVSILQNTTSSDLTNLLNSMASAEGQALLKPTGITAAMLQNYTTQLRDPKQAANAKQALATYATIIQSGAVNTYLHKIFAVYDLYLQRQAAIAAVSSATSSQLLAALQAFAQQVHYLPSFSLTTVNSMINTLQSNTSKSQETVVTQLITWINQANCAQLKYAGSVWVGTVGAPALPASPPVAVTTVPPTTVFVPPSPQRNP